MLALIAKRVLSALPSVIGVIIVTFLLTRALPGDPAAYFAGPAATPQATQKIAVDLLALLEESGGAAAVAAPEPAEATPAPPEPEPAAAASSWHARLPDRLKIPA